METANKLDSLGLDYIVENSDYIFKLASALDTNNEIVKKKVFELLSALCAYSRSGYDRAIETFVHYKVSVSEHSAQILCSKPMMVNCGVCLFNRHLSWSTSD
jgi:hypothetical protein